MGVGERIKKYREQLNLTMKELGELVNISESMISLYEADKNSPKLETVEKMATVFNVNPAYLMFGDDEDLDHRPYDPDSEEILEMLESNLDLKMLFLKTGKLPDAEKKRIAKIIKASLPENYDE